MQTHTTLFNLTTMQPYPVITPVAVCGHCRNLVTIRNCFNHCWHYCGITDCPNSIIGCKQVKTNSRACGSYAQGKGEYLTTDRLFKEISTNQ